MRVSRHFDGFEFTSGVILVFLHKIKKKKDEDESFHAAMQRNFKHTDGLICGHRLCWFVGQNPWDAFFFFPGSRPRCIFIKHWMKECVSLWASIRSVLSHTHTFWTFSTAPRDSSWTWWKALMWTWTLHQFSKEAFNFPQLEAVREKILDIAALQRRSMLPSWTLGAPSGHEDRAPSLKCRTFPLGFLCCLGYCLISSSVRRCEQVLHQLKLCESCSSFRTEQQPAASPKNETNWLCRTIYTHSGW